ncbi:MAG: hypothetical protein ABIY55_01625 [Kofleriaceae bacterium]
MIARGLAICALAACGDNRVAVDAANDVASDAASPVDAPVAPACGAVFSDNFAETWSGPANCATLATADGHTTLAFVIPSQAIDAPFTISIDLGSTPGPGTYSAASLPTPWQVDGLHQLGLTSCLYHAGMASVPPGTFTLALDTLDTEAHGTLDLVLYVLARPFTYCGETNVERLRVTF